MINNKYKTWSRSATAMTAMLFLIFGAGNRFKHEKKMINNKYKIGEINQNIIVMFEIYSTYFFNCCTTVSNYYIVPL